MPQIVLLRLGDEMQSSIFNDLAVAAIRLRIALQTAKKPIGRNTKSTVECPALNPLEDAKDEVARPLVRKICEQDVV
ncbi:MAG: hypothetical protein LQ339_003252 [Xanthoria mediterranea]|nr:MAG: hypothetical protein LQ339_003252 [Xanthoria mediterranea]